MAEPETLPLTGRTGIVSLARHLNLSVSTVSRALNGYNDVAAATRAKIQEAASRLGYVPNVRAQKLRSGRTDSVAFVLSPSQRQYADPFYMPLLTSIDERLHSLGLDLIVTASQPNEHELDVYRRLVDGHRVDGLLFSRTRPHDPRIAFCMDRGFPFVTLGRSDHPQPFPHVDVDHGSSGRHAAATLLELGHRSLALFNTSPRYTYSGHCEQGFHAALAAFAGPVEWVVVDAGMTEESADALAREMFSQAVHPTAFVCGNDAMALGVMHAVAECGLRVGVDVSVIGCNDVPIGRFVSPGLSSFAAPIEEVGRALVESLQRQLRGESEATEAKVFAPTFVPRGSHGPCARAFS